MPKNSYRWFTNKDCEYYPCRDGDINCLFCFAPCYHIKDCPGNPRYLKNGIKDCSKCNYLHTEDGYDKLMKILKKNL
jgi:Zn-finger protein